MRVLTVLSVIVVHSLSILVPEDAGAAGGLLSVFHSSREVFLLLSALVLTYTTGDSAVEPRRFWRRRFPLIAAPYVTWTVIYFLTDGDVRSPGYTLSRLGVDLLTGRARYHLYFVLLTFQLYLVFPWLIRWVRARDGRLLRSAAVALALQLAFTAVVHWSIPVPAPLSWLAARPDSWLPSYELYVFGGIALGLHLGEATAWCSRHARGLAALAVASVAGTEALYTASIHLLGTTPVGASAVFQPSVVVESVAIGAAELGLCHRWAARAGSGALRRVAQGADISFGIYLLHPLILELARNAGVPGALRSLPAPAAVAVVTLVAAPILLTLATVAATLLRRTPLSLWLCGRPPRAATTSPAPVPATAAVLAASGAAGGGPGASSRAG